MARIKVRELVESFGVTLTEGVKIVDTPAAMDLLDTWVADSIVPACCDEGCEVEPDGKCEHGCPSVLIALGLI